MHDKDNEIFLKSCSFFEACHFSFYDGTPTVLQALEMFKGDLTKKETELIRQKFKPYLKDNFKGEKEKKDEYQELKRKILPSVVFPGVVNRKKGATNNKYNGLVVLDLDDTPEPILKKFYDNPPPECVAFGTSVSGYPNGWCLILSEVSNEKDYAHKYAPAIQFWIQKEYGIAAMTSDPKRIRYISYDPDLYINPNPKRFDEKKAKHWLSVLASEENERDSIADDIQETEWSKFCDVYARAKGFEFEPGSRHLYLNRYAICANLLGVPLKRVQKYVYKNLISKREFSNSNALEFPFNSYKSDFGKWGWRLGHNSRPTKNFELLDNKYISDLGVDFCGKILQAPTNSGKTYAAVNLREKIVLAVPYYALSQNVASTYGLTPINGRKKFPEEHSDKYVTTYASLQGLASKLGKKCSDYHLIIDEGHNLTISATSNFMLSDLDYITYCMEVNKFASATILSGTWLPNIHPEIRKKEIIKITKERKAKLLYYHRCENTLFAAVDLANKSKLNGGFPFILQNDTSEARMSLLGALKDKGLRVKAFTSRSKHDEDFEKIVNDSLINSDVSGIVTTTVLKEGNNINNEFESVDIIVVGMFHSSEIEQVSQRFRRAKNINIHILKLSEQENETDYLGSAQQYTWSAYQDACKKLATMDKETSTGRAFEMMFDFYPFKEEDDQLKLDYLKLSEIGVRSEKINEYRNQELQKRNLKGYGIEFVDTDYISGKIEKTTATVERKKEYKAQIEHQYQEMINLIHETPSRSKIKFARDKLRYENDHLSKGEEIALRYFLRLTRFQSPHYVLSEMAATTAIKNRLRKLEDRFIFNACYYILEGKERAFLADLIEFSINCSDWPNLAASIVLCGKKHSIACGKIEREIQLYKANENKSVAHSKIFVQTKRIIEAAFKISSYRENTEEGKKVTKVKLTPRKMIHPHLTSSPPEVSQLIPSLDS